VRLEVRVLEQLEQRLQQAARQRVVLLVGELLSRELANRLEHPEASRVPATQQALVHERLHQVDVGVADPLSGFQRPAAAEDGELREQLLLIGFEQLVRPLDRRPQRLLAHLGVPAAAQEVEAVAQSFEELSGREQGHACGRELECERQVVELRAQLVELLVRLVVGLRRTRPRDEEPPRFGPLEHRHRIDLLALDAQPLRRSSRRRPPTSSGKEPPPPSARTAAGPTSAGSASGASGTHQTPSG
jgi:hypothetical protein